MTPVYCPYERLAYVNAPRILVGNVTCTQKGGCWEDPQNTKSELYARKFPYNWLCITLSTTNNNYRLIINMSHYWTVNDSSCYATTGPYHAPIFLGGTWVSELSWYWHVLNSIQYSTYGKGWSTNILLGASIMYSIYKQNDINEHQPMSTECVTKKLQISNVYVRNFTMSNGRNEDKMIK
jgi:hypothetical protein